MRVKTLYKLHSTMQMQIVLLKSYILISSVLTKSFLLLYLLPKVFLKYAGNIFCIVLHSKSSFL
jgi:hypothetical protein